MLAGIHEVVLVVRLGVGVLARSRAAGEHQAEGHGTSRASRSTGLQRADAGQELDQRADVAGLGAGAGRCWPGYTRWCWWFGWVSARSPGSRAAGEHQAEGHGIDRASRPAGLQRADAGQELDQRADVAGWVRAPALKPESRTNGPRPGLQVLALAENLP
ncbi:hypothetical protein [Sphaerotilus sp.]|uniref:hypothetical protein n=1 Tax=Sphaerotilus sp. TaxID=2093942 RepID=UPI0025E8C97F|nr:hypothetical protein [Sphaerotilus sp.]